MKKWYSNKINIKSLAKRVSVITISLGILIFSNVNYTFLLNSPLSNTLGPEKVEARNTTADFEVNNSYIINYTPNSDYVEIEEILSIRNNNPQYFLPSTGSQIFELPDFSSTTNQEERNFKLDTLNVKDRYGKTPQYEVIQHEDGITVDIKDNVDITYGTNYSLTITYSTHELVNLNGNITNVYIPGLPVDTIFEEEDPELGVTTSYTYKTKVVTPKTFSEPSFKNPESIRIEEGTTENEYIFEQKDRLGVKGWIQFGTKQYYYFKLVQKTQKTDNFIPEGVNKYTDLASTNVYKLPLPKEHDETNQQVMFKNISPEPVKIEKDKEGNLTALFEVPANQNSEIVIEGYIVLSSEYGLENVQDLELKKYIDDIKKDSQLSKYTNPDRYWESDHPEIISRAESVMVGKETLLQLVEADYQYVIDNFEYSLEKVNGNNQRLGALAAFRGAECVCMEYADATIALLRAQGIAARAAVGYGNDPTGAENIIGSNEALIQKVGHQWLQVWVPNYGWLSVDPTWGESERKYIGTNLDHILWYTIGDSSQSFIGTSLSSADLVSSDSLVPYEVYLQALHKNDFPDESSLTPLSSVVDKYEGVKYDKFSYFLKTNTLGKALVIVTPIFIAFTIFLFISKFVIKIVKG